ncbi:Enoyl-CoA hydratase/carnithine racemase [Thermomonospora echinospora]|uniref:Enoyl-CoA hydratase/carnithine racemase n=1 Tax=Thermomonospora echinospora TaxID=1992 RepID=A0A1H6AM00_9ACTN|nr:enoyl-CoA hydratase/isomerase family protein [Thermomonospora echinospora]SEG49561.1 Enoyl-CoA hydratase/carnithine racemase [Thermomonospora echinospora]
MPLDLPPSVRFEVRERVGWLTLDRPEAKNALSRAMYAAVRDVARAARTDPAIDVLVITGSGGSFAVGGDLKEMRAMLTGPNPATILGYEDHLPFEAVRQLPKPTIAVIDGLCMGGGLTLALMCDLRIATESSKFAIPEARVGIVDGHLPRLLRDRVAPAILRRWTYTGAPFTAQEAWRNGLLSELATDAEDLGRRTADILDQLRGSSMTAIAKLKSIFNEAMPLPSMSDAYDSLLREEVRLHLQQFGSRDKPNAAPAAQAPEGNQQ